MRLSGVKLLLSLAASRGLAAPTNEDRRVPAVAQGSKETSPRAALGRDSEPVRPFEELASTVPAHAEERRPLDDGPAELDSIPSALNLTKRAPLWWDYTLRPRRPYIGQHGYFEVADWPGKWSGWRAFLPENFNLSERSVAVQMVPPGHPASLWKMNTKGEMFEVETRAKLERDSFDPWREFFPSHAVLRASLTEDEFDTGTINPRCSFQKPSRYWTSPEDYFFCYVEWQGRADIPDNFHDTWRICDSTFKTFAGPPKATGKTIGYVPGPFLTVGRSLRWQGGVFDINPEPTRQGPSNELDQCDYVLMNFVRTK